MLEDPTVSQSHLRLRVTDRGVLATDLGSTNGTMIEGRRVESAWIAPGERIDLGASRLLLDTLRKPTTLPLSSSERFGRVLGRSVAMRRLFSVLEQVAESDATVLVQGETGSGKDAIAEAIHDASPRRDRPLVVVDCSALADGVVESELFGHERGAFSGAVERRAGAFVAADGGTLFLDEIGELPKHLQPKLLRALENREVRAIGSDKPRAIDVRVIAATHRDLRVDVNQGLFREDLYYRLNVISLRVPALRERREDIPLLVDHFWSELGGDPARGCPDELLAQLVRHPWPGNVRELKNRVERAIVLGEDVVSEVRDRSEPRSYGDAREEALAAFEKAFLGRLIERARGNVSQAARLAKMDRVYLTKLLRKHDLR